jgi:hypothetical protein
MDSQLRIGLAKADVPIKAGSVTLEEIQERSEHTVGRRQGSQGWREWTIALQEVLRDPINRAFLRLCPSRHGNYHQQRVPLVSPYLPDYRRGLIPQSKKITI